MALLGSVIHCNGSIFRALLCKGFNLVNRSKDQINLGVATGTALSRLSLLTVIRLKGRIFLSPERSKLCFELLGMNSAAQNNLLS
jgi:hypothetical protein